MNKYKIISTIRFLNVTDSIKGAFSLMPGVDLITERKKIKKILDKEFGKVSGMIEYEHYKNANHILYCETDETIFQVEGDSNTALILWLLWLEMLLVDSWVVKDNAFMCESAYCKAITPSHSSWSSNRLESSYTLNTGQQHADIDFSIDDIKLWESQCNKLQTYLNDNNSTMFSSFVDKKFSRIGRALRFISSARRETHPAMKISHYCSALESIFSTDNAELSHKLSERVALFLKDHSFNAIETFDKVKSFYNIRSKVTHGDSLKQQSKDLSELSRECDELLRSIINIIISTKEYMDLFDGQKPEFEFYFKNKLLG